jgi:hypothetical protein
MTLPIKALALTALALGLAAGAAQARPLTPAEKRDHAYAARLPACDDPAVLDKIRSRFHDREVEYWKSGLEIGGYDRVREIGWRSWGLDHIPRRYCMARAYMNDHRLRQVSYAIGEGLEMIGWSWGVEWCVHGLDRNNAFAPGCKMARP